MRFSRTSCPIAFVVSIGVVVSQSLAAATPLPNCGSEALVEGSSCADAHADTASLLQVDTFGNKHAAQSQPASAIRANALKPLAWMHVPKTGVNFFNTLMHNPTLCPKTPEDLFLPYDGERPLEDDELFAWFAKFPTELYCPQAWVHRKYGLKIQHHAPIGKAYADNVGHFVTFLRQPEQRLISLYYHGSDRMGLDIDIETFVHNHQGFVVKMLTQESDQLIFDPYTQLSYDAVTQEEDALAVQRLREGFAFVGLTDEWDLSICLFHAMFGGTCVVEEFSDGHVGTGRTSHEPYNTTVLEGFVDVHDGLVYEEGKRIFSANIKEYGMSRSICPSFCKSAQVATGRP